MTGLTHGVRFSLALGAVFLTTPALAQDAPISAEAGLFTVSQYLRRGIAQENEGGILQSFVNVGVTIFDGGEDVISSVEVYGGLWGSLHAEELNAGDDAWYDLHWWYEVDYTLGVRLGLTSVASLDISYRADTSPEDAFNVIHELDFAFSLDDSPQWDIAGTKEAGLHPQARLAIELDGQRDGGNDSGVYFELALTPTITFGDPELTIRLPVTAGFSITDYFEDDLGNDDGLGFFDLGIEIDYPIIGLPLVGSLDLTGGLHAVWLGDSVRRINDIAGNDDVEFVASVGLTWTF